MRRRLGACALCLAGLVTLTGISAATTVATKQRVVIDMKERPGVGSFGLGKGAELTFAPGLPEPQKRLDWRVF